MRRLAVRIAVVACASLALACTDATSPIEFAGTYTLQTVDGLPLPYVFQNTGATKVEALEDTFVLNIAGTYSEAGQKRFTTNGVVTITFPVDAGNFTRRGDAVTLQSLLFGTWTGTVKDNTFTLVQSGLTLVYRR